MKQVLDKMKQFIIKHDELFFVLMFSYIMIGITMYIKTEPTDEVWNFQNIYKMYNGYKIYVDANVITTPLFHIIGLVMFNLFGANFFIFKIYGVIINVTLIFIVYKIFKGLKMSKNLALLFSSVVFVAETTIFHCSSNYNLLSLAISLLGILIIINREKYNNKFIIIESIISFFVFFTKQNIGMFYLLGFIIYEILYEKKNNKIKNILKLLIINFILIITCMIVFNKNEILNGFISYCIFGIKEFSEKNFAIELPIIKELIISIVDILFLVLFNKNKNLIKKQEIKNMNIIACFAFPFLMISYPIFNVVHVDISLFVMYILLMYYIYLFFLDLEVNKNLIGRVAILIITVLSVISVVKTILYFYKIDYSYKYNNIYFGSLLSDELKHKIDKVKKYIENSEENVIAFSTEAALYMMPLNRNNGSMDEPLLGNFGKDGEDGIIKQISSMSNTEILINKEKKVYQESEKIINYIKNNLVYVGEIDDLLIYETKN